MSNIENITPVADAKGIVPTEGLWVVVHISSWDAHLRDKAWNDALYSHNKAIPPSHIKIQELPKRLKEGYVYRPLGDYKDYNNNYILCMKGL